MTKQNQKLLYDHYIAIANNEKKDAKGRDFKPIIRENAATHAEQIDLSFDFSGKKAKAATAAAAEKKSKKPSKGE